MFDKRGWFCTLNNPKLDDKEYVKQLLDLEGLEYLCLKRELSNGLTHIHFYMEFNVEKDIEQLRKVLPQETHIEVRHGQKWDARDYVRKSETSIGKIFEYGDILDNEVY